MNCPNCNAPVDRDAVFCGNCGAKLSPQYAPGVTVAEATQQISDEHLSPYPPRDNSYLSPTVQVNTPPEERPYSPYVKGPAQAGFPQAHTPPPPLVARPEERRTSRRTMFLIGILVLLVVVASGALVTILQNLGKTSQHATSTGTTMPSAGSTAVPSAGSFAMAFFSDSTGQPDTTDTVNITASHLPKPPAGSQYNVWIVDDANERITLVGVLQPQGQNFAVSYTDPHHLNLLSLGTELRITQEKQGASTIVGNTVLTASMPIGAFTHIKHLLFRFDTTPHNVGLLVGLREQARVLFAQANSLQVASNQHNNFAVQCYAQSIVDIIEGNHGPHYQPLSAGCVNANIAEVGDGFGLLDLSGAGNGYVALAKAHAGFAAQAPDATSTVKLYSQHVQVCMDNLDGWLKSIDNDATTIMANNNIGTQAKEITQRADYVVNGVDLNNNGTVEPIAGEGGAMTAYAQAQLMAQLRLVPKPA